jgi:hypothetical protein
VPFGFVRGSAGQDATRRVRLEMLAFLGPRAPNGLVCRSSPRVVLWVSRSDRSPSSSPGVASPPVVPSTSCRLDVVHLLAHRPKESDHLVGPLLGSLDQVLPWRVLLRLALAWVSRSALPYDRADGEDELSHTAKFLGPVLKMGDVRLTPLVRDGVVPAPLGGDPPEVAAGVLSLSVVAHVVCLV